MSDPVAAPEPRFVMYECGDGTTREFSAAGDYMVSLTWPDTVWIPRVRSASGARFQAPGREIWIHGDSATVNFGSGEQHCGVMVPTERWVVARNLGYLFRGIGQEPGWSVAISRGNYVEFSGDYGERSWRGDARVVDAGEGRLVYEADTDNGALRVETVEEPCQDTMSGESFTHRVEVAFAGEELSGCGRIP